MFEDWKEKRKAIKKHILKIYDGTNSQNKDELNRFLEFVIDNYDLDDNIFEQIKEDLDIVEDEDENYQENKKWIKYRKQQDADYLVDKEQVNIHFLKDVIDNQIKQLKEGK